MNFYIRDILISWYYTYHHTIMWIYYSRPIKEYIFATWFEGRKAQVELVISQITRDKCCHPDLEIKILPLFYIYVCVYMKNAPMLSLFLPNPLVRKVENKEFLQGKLYPKSHTGTKIVCDTELSRNCGVWKLWEARPSLRGLVTVQIASGRSMSIMLCLWMGLVGSLLLRADQTKLCRQIQHRLLWTVALFKFGDICVFTHKMKNTGNCTFWNLARTKGSWSYHGFVYNHMCTILEKLGLFPKV